MCIGAGASTNARCDAVRIALATDWFAPRLGGIEQQLLELASRLARRGHEVDVLTTTPGDDPGAAFRVRRLAVLRLPGIGVAISPRIVGAVSRELARGYDVVHCHASVVSPLAYTALVAARARDLPVVVTFHSVLRHKRHLLRVAGALARVSQARVAWTAVSAAVAEQAASALGVPVDVLPNGTNVGFWRATPSLRSTAACDEVRVVFAGRLERKKRPLSLVRAFIDATRRVRAPARLVIAGDGAERRSVERQLRTDACDHVELVGWKTADELRSIYASADAFAMASRRESFGIAALEARAAGLPVIAMASAGCSDFLTHGQDALLAADDGDLADHLARFLADRTLRARLAAATTPVERYDWSAVIAAHETAYGRAISRAGSPRAAAPTP